MKKFVLIYNPVSGKAKWFKSRLDNILEAFQRWDCMLIIYRTKKDNSGLGIYPRSGTGMGRWRPGGDGTPHEVVNLLMREHIELPVAILPSGTSNDFATYLGVDADQEAYFDHIAAGRTRKVDLGLVGSEYFVNVASAGMVTSIAHESMCGSRTSWARWRIICADSVHCRSSTRWSSASRRMENRYLMGGPFCLSL